MEWYQVYEIQRQRSDRTSFINPGMNGNALGATRSPPGHGGPDAAMDHTDIVSLRLKLDPTRKVTSKYRWTGIRLGKGGYASVYEVHERSTGARRACKIISKKRVEDLELLERELQVLISLDHPNVIRMLSWYESDNNLYVIMELCEGGELFDVIDKREELYSGSIIRQIFLGVAYLHQVGIVHRDLKLENCLFKTKDMRSCVKLIDFGLAGLKPMYHDKPWLKDVLGTALYMAPEVISDNTYYDEKCDSWSVGIIMYIMLTGQHPFWTPKSLSDENELFERVKTMEPDLSKIPSKAAAELVGLLLQKDPTKRPSAREALNHPWLRQHEFYPAYQQRQLLHNLRSFGNFRRLERAVLTVIAFNTSSREMEQMRETFITLDKDNSGGLSPQEIVSGLRRLDIEIPDDIDQILESVDADQSGEVDYTEFVAAVMDRNNVMQKEAVDAAFNWFDQDSNGKISRAELEEVVGDEEANWAIERFAKLPLSRPWLDRDDFVRVVQAIAMIKDESSSSGSEVSEGEISSAPEYLPACDDDDEGQHRHRQDSRGSLGGRRKRIKRRCRKRCQSWCGLTLVTQSEPSSPHALAEAATDDALKRLQEGRPGTPAVPSLTRRIGLDFRKSDDRLGPLNEDAGNEKADFTRGEGEASSSVAPPYANRQSPPFNAFPKRSTFQRSPSKEPELSGESMPSAANTDAKRRQAGPLMNPLRTGQYLLPPADNKVERQRTNSSSDPSSSSELWESLESLPKLQIPSSLPPPIDPSKPDQR
ncbi:hypothetical protein FOZ62_007131 [Perkinsus olseni]|uniref:non-specific serine/threonine protein kinase n=1 Tax=Perkinsus olseni TaxID=32597 RepID=A0A7J6Q9L2_PEROL|nr:hypothetical protein FOZ62_007131 [Perkinsus olseni]